MRIALFLLQLAFALTWTVYVIYLPALLAKVGIGKEWVPVILIVDQLLFAVSDITTGKALDRVERFSGRWGILIGLAIAGSAALFVCLPWLASTVPPSVFLVVLMAWVMLSSLARVPPLVILAKHTNAHGTSKAIAVYLLGIGLAGAVAPFLGVALKSVSPLLPFALASASLAAVALWCALAWRSQAEQPAAAQGSPAPSVARGLGLLVVAALVMGIAIQMHTGLISAPRYTLLRSGIPLEWLMPVFWSAFSIVLWPVTFALARTQPRPLWLMSLSLGSVAFAFLWFTGWPLWLTITLQAMAGIAWGMAFMLLLDSAQRAGRSGLEGQWLGWLLAALAIATALRLAIANGLGSAAILTHLSGLQALVVAAWVVAGLAVIIAPSLSRRT
jgi:Major Facilitator Superfamily